MKAQLRRQMRAKLLALPIEEVSAKSRAACLNLASEDEFRRAGAIMIFLSIPGEVDTSDLALAAWQQEKAVLVPKVGWEQKHLLPVEIRSLDSDLAAGQYGIREPVEGKPWPLESIDLIIVPALAYDRAGYRLGRGGGFYDRFLAHPQIRAVRCGLALDEQLVESLPVHEHDYPVDMLVTDKQVLRFARARSAGRAPTAPRTPR